MIVPVLFIVTGNPGFVAPFTAASPIPPDTAVIVPPLFVILWGPPIVPSYVPSIPVAPSPIFRFPVELRLPFEVAASDPEPVTVMLFPRLSVPPLLYTPIPPPAKKLNVKLPAVPRLAVPPATYTPVPPLIFIVDVPVAKVVPVGTYIPIPPSVVTFPLWLRVIPAPPRYTPTPFLAFTLTLFIVYVPVIPASNNIPTDVFVLFVPVVILAPLNDTLLSRTYTPTESCPVVIFPDITELVFAATPTASVPTTFTAKSILAFSPNTPTPPEAIFKVPAVILLVSVFFR